MQGAHAFRAFEMTLPFGGIIRIRFNGYDLNRSGCSGQYPCCLYYLQIYYFSTNFTSYSRFQYFPVR